VIHLVGTVGGDLHFKDGGVAVAGNAFDGSAHGGEIFGETMVVDLEVNEFAKPCGRNLHVSFQLSAISYQLSATDS